MCRGEDWTHKLDTLIPRELIHPPMLPSKQKSIRLDLRDVSAIRRASTQECIDSQREVESVYSGRSNVAGDVDDLEGVPRAISLGRIRGTSNFSITSLDGQQHDVSPR